MQRRRVAETVSEGLALLVPQLATSAMIYLRESADAPLRLVDLLHTDPVQQEQLRQLFEALPLGDDPRRASAAPSRAGGSRSSATSTRRSSTGPPRSRRCGPDCWPRERPASLAVPLVAHGEALGFIGLVGTRRQRTVRRPTSS